MNEKPYYLFVCIENACRSQMAEGLFNSLTIKAIAKSAGTKPSKVNPMAIEIMKEKNIDILLNKSKVITPEMVQNAKKIITMGCIDACPYSSPEKTIKWDIPDPKMRDKQFFIEIRDLIETKIIQLLKAEGLTDG